MNMKDSADEYATKNRRRVCFNRFLFVVNRRHITHARSPDQNRFYSRADEHSSSEFYDAVANFVTSCNVESSPLSL